MFDRQNKIVFMQQFHRTDTFIYEGNDLGVSRYRQFRIKIAALQREVPAGPRDISRIQGFRLDPGQVPGQFPLCVRRDVADELCIMGRIAETARDEAIAIGRARFCL